MRACGVAMKTANGVAQRRVTTTRNSITKRTNKMHDTLAKISIVLGLLSIITPFILWARGVSAGAGVLAAWLVLMIAWAVDFGAMAISSNMVH